MADRARLAKLPPPGPGLKCPRCDSTNTKFCYFNNYSLLQPRHFCKTCRRYWTRGGALRNVPVGGGCRRNRRNKAGGASKTTDRQSGSSGLGQISPALTAQTSQPVLSPIQHHLLEYGAAGNLGLNFAGFSPNAPQEQWKIQQFPPTAMGLFPFNAEVGDGSFMGQIHGKDPRSSSGLISNMGLIKMEENPRDMNLTRQYLTMSGDNQYWNVPGSGNTSNWTELPDFNSSAGHIL